MNNLIVGILIITGGVIFCLLTEYLRWPIIIYIASGAALLGYGLRELIENSTEIE